MTTLKLRGERVALRRIEEKLSGTIVLPEQVKAQYQLAVVETVGDGIDPITKKQAEMFVKPGDVVFYQQNDFMLLSSTYRFDNALYVILLQTDLIARLTANQIALNNFEILGSFVLVKPWFRTEGAIVIPDTAVNIADLRWTMIQRGCNAKDLPEDQTEIVLERTRATPFKMCESSLVPDSAPSEYCYVDKSFIFGEVIHG